MSLILSGKVQTERGIALMLDRMNRRPPSDKGGVS